MSAGFRYSTEGSTRVLWLEGADTSDGSTVRAVIDLEAATYGDDFVVDLGGVSSQVGERLESQGCRSRNPGPASYSLRLGADRRFVAACTCGWLSRLLTTAGLAGAVWYEHSVDVHGTIDLR